jgi:cob(I)alamin adenosyltransferase
MKIYTGMGDKGETGLYSGERVSKAHERIHAFGTLEELSAFIGLLISKLSEEDMAGNRETLLETQKVLGEICARLAVTPGSPKTAELGDINALHLELIESLIDEMLSELPDLNTFILPGGSQTAALAHVCRTICRRGERDIIRMLEIQSCDTREFPLPVSLAFINRLSDYFFVLARHINWRRGIRDVPWQNR